MLNIRKWVALCEMGGGVCRGYHGAHARDNPQDKTHGRGCNGGRGFPVWKAETALALVKIHEGAMTVTRDDGFWTRLYVRGLDPDEAANAAAREYDAAGDRR